MNTNSNLTGVSGVCNVTVPTVKKDLNAFVAKHGIFGAA